MANPAYQKLKDMNALPSPTGVGLEILRLASDEKATLDAIVAVVEADPALAGRMLKLVNSPFAGVPRHIASVSAAAKLLGLRTVKNLSLGLSLISGSRNGPCKAFDYGTFWSESLGRAVAARQIAGRLKNFPPDEAFATGLLGRIGLLALATVHPKEYARLLDVAGGSAFPELAERERQAFGIDHNELSAEMMAEWRLPEFLCEAVRSQDSPKRADSDPASQAGQLARTLHLAGAIASVFVQPQTHLEMLTALVEEASGLGIAKEAFDQLFDSIGSEWREAGAIFSVSTRNMEPLEELRARAEAAGGPASGCSTRSETNQGAAKTGSDALRILIVDDDPAALRLLEKYLTAAGYRVTTAANGAEALAIDRVEPAQMIIADWMMPEMGGIELCRRLRAHESSGFVYIIVVTAQSEEVRGIEARDAGANDFLAKPFSREELLARVRAGEWIVRLEANLAERSREVACYSARLVAANDQLRIAATTDELTGLTNRREGMARLAEHWVLAARYGEPLACIIADIDHFKRFNDTYGHAAGDAVLKATAIAMQSTSRAGDLVCRTGGEEFLVICPKSTAASAREAADRMHSAVAANAVKFNEDEWSTTISLGVAERAESMRHPDELLKAADEMLYAAKRAGWNRVCLAGAPIAPEPSKPKRAKTTKQRCAPPAADPGSPPVRILVVDDDAQARALYRKLLEREGYVVSEATDGLEALQEVSTCSPDVIILDAMMPNLDGFECTRRLKADGAKREIPIIMVSAKDGAESIEAGLEAGADEYLTKPFRHREFVLRVRSMVRLHRSKAELLSINHVRWEQARSLQALLDLSVGLVSAENLDGILERVVSAVADLARCRRVSVMLPDSEGKFLTIAKCVGLDEATAGAVRVPVGGAVAGQVFLSGEQVIVNSPEDPSPRPDQYDSQFFVSAPLISKTLRAMERTVGVLNITERHGQRPFGRNELECIDLLCNIAGTAINNFLSRQERDEAQNSIVVALAALAECRDTDTGGHLDRVTRFALMLAEELRNKGPCGEQIDDAFIQALRRAMPLHDIGKVGVPDHILLKPGRLTDADMEQMRRHAEIGAQTIRSVTARMPGVSFLRIAEEIAWSHHEWWDGSGYPRGLSGRNISLSGRIAAIADVYDALTTKRVYKDAMPHQEAVAIIREGAGTQFDPAVVEAFLRRQDEFGNVAAETGNTHVETGNGAIAGAFEMAVARTT